MRPRILSPAVLELDSPRWDSLGHAYGAAGDVPAMLRAVAADPDEEDGAAWAPIWSALCHQGTVYTASYAAVPLIVELGAGLPPAQQRACWTFVGCVARSTDGPPIPDDLREAYEAALVRCEPMIRATIVAGSAEEADVVYLLAAVAAVRGHGGVASALEGMADGFAPVCPGCEAELTVEWDGRRFQVTEDGTATVAVTVAASQTVPRRADPSEPTWDEDRVSAHLLELAEAAGHPVLVAQLIHWEGIAICPACEHRFALRSTLVDQAG